MFLVCFVQRSTVISADGNRESSIVRAQVHYIYFYKKLDCNCLVYCCCFFLSLSFSLSRDQGTRAKTVLDAEATKATQIQAAKGTAEVNILQWLNLFFGLMKVKDLFFFLFCVVFFFVFSSHRHVCWKRAQKLGKETVNRIEFKDYLNTCMNLQLNFIVVFFFQFCDVNCRRAQANRRSRSSELYFFACQFFYCTSILQWSTSFILFEGYWLSRCFALHRKVERGLFRAKNKSISWNIQI